MASASRIDLRIFADGAPASGAIVQVRRMGAGDGTDQGVIAVLRSDADGRVVGLASMLRDEGKLDIVVIKPGFRGPYEPADEQAQLGAFAPAARFALDAADLESGLRIDLASKENK